MYRLLVMALALTTGATEASGQQRIEASIFAETEEPLFGHPSDPTLVRSVDIHPSVAMELPATEYPAWPRRVGIRGRVAVKVLIGADDKLLYCEVSRSTGSLDLTNAACPLLRRHGAFRHALAYDGTPREAWMRITVVFDFVVSDESAVVYVPPPLAQPSSPAAMPAVLDPDALVLHGVSVALFPDTRRPQVHLTLDASGFVTRCSISVSSGSDRGDLLACQAASSARFSPRRDASGNAVASSWSETLTVAP